MHILIPALHRPTKPTGVCRHAANLVRSLATHDRVSRITLLIGVWQTTYFEQSFVFDIPEIEVISIDIDNTSISRNRWFMFGLPKLAQKLSPDVVHLSFPFPFIRSWFTMPVVTTIHDVYPFECPENFGYPSVWFNQVFLRQCIASSDGLITVSQCTLNALSHHFPNVPLHKQTTVIYNIVDFKNLQPKIPAQIKRRDPSQFLLTVAQHRKNKNLDLLLQAFGHLFYHGQLPADIQLVLVGSSGPETGHLMQHVQSLGLQDQVVFLSGLKDEELCWLYEHASLFVIPSSTEGFCLPLVEAIASGCPVVCSDIPIFREVGASRCHYFSLEGNPLLSLSTSIIQCSSEPRRREKFLDPRFSKKQVAQQLLEFYTQHIL